MTVQDKTTLKSYFADGELPTEQEYIDLIDSFGNMATNFYSSNPATPPDLNIDGVLTIGDPGGEGKIHVNGDAGYVRDLIFDTDGFARWIFRTTSGTEGGSNVSSDFEIRPRADDGSDLGFISIGITRASGIVKIGNWADDSTKLVVGRYATGHPYLYVQPDETNGLVRLNTNSSYALYIGNGTAPVNMPGRLNLGADTGSEQVYINGAAGQVRDIVWQSGGSNRWILRTSGDAESGSNAGSNFQISRRDDSGNLIDYPIIIYRDTGNVLFKNQIHCNDNILSDTFLQAGGETITSASYLYLIAPAGYSRNVLVKSGSSLRWKWGADSVAESGSNAGSDFRLLCYDDSGGYIATPLIVKRSTGDVTLYKKVTIVDEIKSEGPLSWGWLVNGFNTITTGIADYYKIGFLVHVNLDFIGAGDGSTTTTITLPYTSHGSMGPSVIRCRIQNNSAWVDGVCVLNAGSSVLNVYPAVNGGTWSTTPSVSRAFQVHFSYIANT